MSEWKRLLTPDYLADNEYMRPALRKVWVNFYRPAGVSLADFMRVYKSEGIPVDGPSLSLGKKRFLDVEEESI